MQVLLLVLLGLAIARIVFVATGGHVIFLPLFFLLPFGLLGLGRRRNRAGQADGGRRRS
jgi:hypothetical protein